MNYQATVKSEEFQGSYSKLHSPISRLSMRKNYVGLIFASLQEEGLDEPHLDPKRVRVLDTGLDHLLVDLLQLEADLLVGGLQLEANVGDVVLLQTSRLDDVDETDVEVGDDVVASRDGHVFDDGHHPVDVAHGPVV